MTFTERVSRFGPGHGLTGILSLPRVPAAPGTGVILLNSGVIHRVGSNRLYVELARGLAASGVLSLRFDLSGIGDSARRAEASSVRDSVQRDVSDAVAYLRQAHHVEHVVLVGLCSGAFDAFVSAGDEPQVSGAFMVDLPGPFRDISHRARHIATRLFRLESWRNPLRSLWGHSRSAVKDAMGTGAEGGTYAVGARGASTRARMAEQLTTLLDRGVRLHFLFTAGLETNYNHPNQFQSTFPDAARHPLLSTAFYPDADHAFAASAMRKRLVADVVRWVATGTPRRALRPTA